MNLKIMWKWWDQAANGEIDYLPDESPCSPIIQPWHEVGAIFRRWLMRKRNRDESKFVPEPMTRFFGNPLNFHATYVKISTGLDTTIKMVFGLYSTNFGMIPLKMSVLRCTKSKRLSPGRWRAPAVIMHKREPALTEKSVDTTRIFFNICS